MATTTPVAELRSSIEDIESGLGRLQKQVAQLRQGFSGMTSGAAGGLRQLGSVISQVSRDFDKLQKTMRQQQAPTGVVGGARISQALGSLTGMGRGGGGGGGGRAFTPWGQRLSRTALAPLQYGVPMLAGALASAPFQAMGGVSKALGKIPGIGGVFRGAGALAGGVGKHVVRPVVEGLTHMGLGFGTSYLRQAMSAQEQLEQASRFTGRTEGDRRGFVGGLAGGRKHGYDFLQTLQHREAVQRAVGGPGRGFGNLEGPMQAMSNRLRQPMGSVVNAAAAMRTGGMDMGQITNVLQRIERSILGAGFKQSSPTFMRRAEALLSSIAGFTAQQVSITGAANAKQIASFQHLANALSNKPGRDGGFDIKEASRRALQLQNISMAPGGGEAGEIFVQRALGFGASDFAAQKATAKKLGLNPNLVRRRNYWELQRARANRPLATQLIATRLLSETPGSEMQAELLKVLSQGQISFPAAEKIIGRFRRGVFAQKDVQGLLGPGDLAKKTTAGAGGTTGLDMRAVTALQEWTQSIADLSGVPGGLKTIVALTELTRNLQIIGGHTTITLFQKLFGGSIEDFNKKIDQNRKKIQDSITEIIDQVFKYIQDQLGIQTTNNNTRSNGKVLV